MKPPRTIEELLPDGKVPTVNQGFDKWFDDLSPEELDTLWKDKDIQEAIGAQVRKPGGLHEWCMVCRAPDFKRWGVSIDEIKRFRTRTTELVGTNPKDGTPFAHSVFDPQKGRVVSGPGSKTFHNELQQVIVSSKSLDDFNNGVRKLVERWKIDPKLLPPLPKGK